MKKANNMAELENLILNEMQNAMKIVQSKSEKDTQNEVKSFYSQGSPKIYKRTGKLGKSVRKMGVSRYRKTVHFYIWLDRTYNYTVPNPDFIDRGFASYFTTPMVFDAAEAGTANIKGRSGFWARSEKKIESDLNTTFKGFFR